MCEKGRIQSSGLLAMFVVPLCEGVNSEPTAHFSGLTSRSH